MAAYNTFKILKPMMKSTYNAPIIKPRVKKAKTNPKLSLKIPTIKGIK